MNGSIINTIAMVIIRPSMIFLTTSSAVVSARLIPNVQTLVLEKKVMVMLINVIRKEVARLQAVVSLFLPLRIYLAVHVGTNNIPKC